MSEKNSFDQLVSTLSSAERKEMLERMQVQGGNPDEESLESVDTASDSSVSFETEYRNISFFFRFWLWLKSIFTNTSVETLFNDYKVGVIARNIEHISPGLIDYRRKSLLTSFFNKLNDLKRCADFFKPYCALIDDDGDFYVFLGTLGMPQIAQQMSNEVDPYSIPLDKGPRPDQRISLLRRMDEVMANIPSDQKTVMYSCARASEWLLQFVRLPINHLLSLFDPLTEHDYTCHFSVAQADLGILAQVLCNGLSIPNEVLESLYLYYQERGRGRNDSSKEAAEKFMEAAHFHLSMMHTFVTSVPFRSLCCVANRNAQWTPENFKGAEDWFVKYKMGWKKLFDMKWEAWTNDCRKESLRQILQRTFGLNTFPHLPSRPWITSWANLRFRYELTGGFLCWFFREAFPVHEIVLKTVMTEGAFIQKENNIEFTETFNEFLQVSIGLDTVNRNCAPDSELDVTIKKLEKEHTLLGQEKAEKLLRGVEADFAHLIVKFGDASRKMNLLMTGIVGLSMDPRYDSLSNMGEIQGRNNARFRKQLQDAKDAIDCAFNLVKELEPVDTPSLTR